MFYITLFKMTGSSFAAGVFVWTPECCNVEPSNEVEITQDGNPFSNPIMILPTSWEYETKMQTFYRVVTSSNFESEWYTTEYEAKQDELNSYFDTHIQDVVTVVPSAEQLLLNCYTYMITQEARKMVTCLGCQIDHPSQVQHLDGCLAESEQIVYLYEDEAFEKIKHQDLAKFYNDVRDQLNLGKVFILCDLKKFCKSKGCNFYIHPAYTVLFQRMYNVL